MNSKTRSAMGIALLAMTLAGCMKDSSSVSDLPPVPADIKACFQSEGVPFPNPGRKMTRKQVAQLIVDLKTSEVEKTKCGRRLVAWYEKLR